MDKLLQIFQRQTCSGDPVKAGDIIVTPQSEAISLRWPYGGLVWNRPVAVLVEKGAQTERIPIVDVTRVVQVELLGLSVILSIITLMMTIRHKRESNG
jgi:hypothetical protein